LPLAQQVQRAVFPALNREPYGGDASGHKQDPGETVAHC